MKFTAAAVLAVASGAMANNVTAITETVDSYVTYCPGPTVITHGSMEYTVTEATTLTITDCPCTITKPIIPTSTVVCDGDCPAPPAPTSEVPEVPPTPPQQPPHNNGTIPGSVPTNDVPTPPENPSSVPTAGAAKVAGFSGLVGVVGLVAYFL